MCQLSVAHSTATVGDLLKLDKVVMHVKSDNLRLYFPKIKPLERCYLECFSDARFANLSCNGSRGVFVIFLRDEKGAKCPIYWQTKKI